MQHLKDLHDRITSAGFAGSALCVVVIILTFWFEVAARYFFAAPTVWAYALASYVLAPMIFLAMPEMSRRGSQIVVDYFAAGLPEAIRKPLEVFIALAGAAICLICAWITFSETFRQFQAGDETISAWTVPKWWISIFAPYGLFSTAIYFVRQIFEKPVTKPAGEGL